jgi:spermidine/putrescine-binding protein
MKGHVIDVSDESDNAIVIEDAAKGDHRKNAELEEEVKVVKNKLVEIKPVVHVPEPS